MRKITLSKRQKFVIAAVLQLVGIIIIRAVLGDAVSWRLRLGVYALISLVVTTLALKDEDYNGIEWLMLPILPSFFAVSSALVFPLMPDTLESLFGFVLRPDTSLILTLFLKMVFLSMFVVGYYAALLTSNIFNVAAVRSIQLLRVAHSIGFLMTVTSALFFYIGIVSFHQSAFVNFGIVFGVTLPLSLQSVWSINLEKKIGEQVRNYTLLIGIVLAEVAWILSFWPIGVSIFALFLTAIFYELVGIVQYHLGEKLNSRIANEFIVVAVAVFLLTVITTVWGA